MPEACPLCLSADTRRAFALTDHRIAACAACGLLFHDGFRGGGEDGELFGEEYFRVRHREAFERQLADYRADPSTPVYERWLDRIEELVPRGRILDVGSGLGSFLAVARERGWQPDGVEISHFAAGFSRRRHGLDVFLGGLEELPEEPGSFAAVTFWDSIEHLARPRQDLARAASLLDGDGVILLATDNFDCLVADLARWGYTLTGGRWRYPMDRVFIDRNRSFFTLATLTKLIDGSGLEVIEAEKMEYPLGKIRTNRMERWVLRALYAAAAGLGRQAQVTVLARKRRDARE